MFRWMMHGVMMWGVQGCCGPLCQLERLSGVPEGEQGVGGGADALRVDLPFAEGYESQCMQGVGGSYSHRYTSTYYDVDLDTPNDRDDIVYAPAGGVAYVHHDGDGGFGLHINLDQGDGTYLLLAHLDRVFVDDGDEVAAGQILGIEGTTGASTGDHVHLGRHEGSATESASYGASVPGLTLAVDDVSGDGAGDVAVEEMVCDLEDGAVYASLLRTPLWHPGGSLVMTPDNPDVYLLVGGERQVFEDEAAFWSRGYDFGEVAWVDDAELACYEVGSRIAGQNDISAAYDAGTVWLLHEGDRTRQRLASAGWQGVLKSWGITAATYDDLPAWADVHDAAAYTTLPGNAPLRDGSLVSEVSTSDVYAIADGVAMPIVDWDTYLLMGFLNRTVIELDDGTVASLMSQVGDCRADSACITRQDVITCGGDDEPDYGGGGETTTDTGDDTSDDSESPAEMGEDTLLLTWTVPSGVQADRITLSGEFTQGGVGHGWATLAETRDATVITYSRSAVHSGDSLRFSVEYEERGAVSWSCLAPYPPGTVQGVATAQWNGDVLAVTTADDPSSDGCGLLVTVP